MIFLTMTKRKDFHRLYLDVFFKSYAAVEMRFILPIGESSLLYFIKEREKNKKRFLSVPINDMFGSFYRVSV